MGLNSVFQGVKFASIAVKAGVMSAFNEDAAKGYLLRSLGSMPGLTAKAAQMLSMKLGVDEHADLMPEAMELDLVKALIHEAHPILFHQIVSIDAHPYVASLGQVHRVELADGRHMAVKVQFPGIQSQLKGQLDLLMTSSGLGPAKKYGFRVDDFRDFFLEKFKEETDYLHEANGQLRFYETFASLPGIIIPRPEMDLCGQTVLVQEWVHGLGMGALNFWPEDARRDLTKALGRFLIKGVFVEGLVHTDLHPGNLAFKVDSTHEVIVYDYGSHMEVGSFESSVLRQMIDAYREEDTVDPFNYLVALGFDPDKLKHIANVLPMLCKFLVEPFTSQGAINFEQWSLDQTLDDLLGEDKWWFRMSGPPWFLLLMRAVQGNIFLHKKLGVGVCYRALLSEVLPANYEKVKIPNVSQDFLKEVITTDTIAKYLKVLVLEKETGNQVVKLEMPARSVDSLENLIPEDTLVRFKQAHDLVKIKKDVMRKGYMPCVLFSSETAERTYKVWLE